MPKDCDGHEIHVGDVLVGGYVVAGKRTGDSRCTRTVTEICGNSAFAFDPLTRGVERCDFVNDHMWRILRRADGSAPAAESGEEFRPGAFHEARNRLSWCDIVIRDGKSGSAWVVDHSMSVACGRATLCPAPAPSHHTYRGNIATAVEEFLTALTVLADADYYERPGPSSPEPVDAETLAAKQRERCKAEAAALQERYAAFRATVTRVVAEEAPAARVVTDMARQFQGVAFVGWLSIDDLRAEINIRYADDAELAEHRTRAALNDFRHRLGARALGRKL